MERLGTLEAQLERSVSEKKRLEGARGIGNLRGIPA